MFTADVFFAKFEPPGCKIISYTLKSGNFVNNVYNLLVRNKFSYEIYCKILNKILKKIIITTI